MINAEFHAALYDLYKSTRNYQRNLDFLSDLHDKGNPDSLTEFSKAETRAKIHVEYQTIKWHITHIDGIIEKLKQTHALGQDF
jgi:hypothetical protein